MREFATFEERLSAWTTGAMVSVFDLTDTEVHLGVSPTNNEKFGDYQCNAAMELARTLKKAPRQIAQEFVDAAELPDFIEKIEIAGPGFINFFISDHAFQQLAVTILDAGEAYGRSRIGNGRRIQVEFVSANPTGPLHVGHGRGHSEGLRYLVKTDLSHGVPPRSGWIGSRDRCFCQTA